MKNKIKLYKYNFILNLFININIKNDKKNIKN